MSPNASVPVGSRAMSHTQSGRLPSDRSHRLPSANTGMSYKPGSLPSANTVLSISPGGLSTKPVMSATHTVVPIGARAMSHSQSGRLPSANTVLSDSPGGLSTVNPGLS